MAAVVARAYAVAARHFHEALQIAIGIGFVPRTHTILTGVAELFLLLGEAAQAASVLVAVLRHPASDRETSERARSLLGRCALWFLVPVGMLTFVLYIIYYVL